jgi:hypothetical protein
MLLPPSDGKPYNLMVHDGAHQEWRHWANGIGQPFQTTAGQKIENLELRLTRGGMIRGRVVDEHGEPQVGVLVQATASDRLEHVYYHPSTRSDDDGRFELRCVRPGKHLLHGSILFRNDDPQAKQFPVVQVTAGEITRIGDLVIPPQFRESPFEPYFH